MLFRNLAMTDATRPETGCRHHRAGADRPAARHSSLCEGALRRGRRAGPRRAAGRRVPRRQGAGGAREGGLLGRRRRRAEGDRRRPQPAAARRRPTGWPTPPSCRRSRATSTSSSASGARSTAPSWTCSCAGAASAPSCWRASPPRSAWSRPPASRGSWATTSCSPRTPPAAPTPRCMRTRSRSVPAPRAGAHHGGRAGRAPRERKLGDDGPRCI